jgi:hypothetical protein
MNVAIDLGVMLQLLLVGGVGWLLSITISTNNKMREIQAWIKGHDKQDDERHTEIKEQISTLWENIKKRSI